MRPTTERRFAVLAALLLPLLVAGPTAADEELRSNEVLDAQDTFSADLDRLSDDERRQSANVRRATLREMSPEERRATVERFRERRDGRPGSEGGNVRGDRWQERRERLKEMTPEQRQSAVERFREHQGDRRGLDGGAFRGEQWQDRGKRLKEMSPEQRKAAMQPYRDGHRTEADRTWERSRN